MIPLASPGLPEVRAKIRSCEAAWIPVFQVFSPLMTQSSPSRTAVVSMMRGVGAVLGFGDAEREAAAPRPVVDPLRLLRLAAVLSISSSADVVADDRVLVLQVVVQPEAHGARCSRMTAMARFVPSRPPNSAGNGNR